MRFLIPAFVLLSAVPAAADVTHSYEGRFGVRYDSAAPAGQQTRSLYEGRYTTTFTHQLDSGMRFRFDIGVLVSNYDSPRRPGPEPSPTGPDAGN